MWVRFLYQVSDPRVGFKGESTGTPLFSQGCPANVPLNPFIEVGECPKMRLHLDELLGGPAQIGFFVQEDPTSSVLAPSSNALCS